ncbi:MAG: helix-turn-helix transcriptional regulator, partial [Enterococcus faecium]|nr:helix-turn-helix transcriptional regulator [Enterococcus faecium]
MDFKDKIKINREKLGYTLEELSKLVGVSAPTIQRYESGEIKNVRRDKIAKLAEALKVSPSYLMGWEDENKDPILEN